jgi:F-type H+-transporting ATPase subunit b
MLAIDVNALSDAVKEALGINPIQMLIQIAATIVLVIIVRYFFWNKITAYLEKRRELFTAEMENAKKLNLEATMLQEQALKETNDLKLRSKELITLATQKGEQERLLIVAKAKADAEHILSQSRQTIEAEKDKARTSLKNEVIDLATLMAEKIIKSEIDDSKYKDMSLDEFERSEEV